MTSSNSSQSTRPTSALGRIARPISISLVITSGRVKFLTPVMDPIFFVEGHIRNIPVQEKYRK